MNSSHNTISHAIKLKPGDDVRDNIEKYVIKRNINAGWLVTCAESLTTYNISFANQEKRTAHTVG